MRERLFVDTVFVIALINYRDQYHHHAVEVSHKFEGCPLLTTDAVLLEIGNALSRGYKTQGSLSTLQRLSPKTHEVYLNAVNGLAVYYNQSPDRLSFVR